MIHPRVNPKQSTTQYSLCTCLQTVTDVAGTTRTVNQTSEWNRARAESFPAHLFDSQDRDSHTSPAGRGSVSADVGVKCASFGYCVKSEYQYAWFKSVIGILHVPRGSYGQWSVDVHAHWKMGRLWLLTFQDLCQISEQKFLEMF